MAISFDEMDEATVEFAKKVVRQSKGRLTRGGTNATRELYNSIGFRWDANKKLLQFVMSQHGAFIDRGVEGSGRGNWKSSKTPARALRDSKGVVFKYRRGGPGKKFHREFVEWLMVKGIRLRNKKGQYLDRDTAAFLVRRNVGRFGIKPRKFFTDSFNGLYPKYVKNLPKTVGPDVQAMVTEMLTELKGEDIVIKL